jgi:hypothetical protein
MEEKDQQDNLQGVNRELGNPPDSSSPEGRVKFECASQGYESSSEESVEEENNRENRYIGNKGLAQASRVAPLEFKASLLS